jgi:hypothetical protein
MEGRKKFCPKIARTMLKPEQAVLFCQAWVDQSYHVRWDAYKEEWVYWTEIDHIYGKSDPDNTFCSS